ncbi:monocarboxylate transporter 2-like [Amphiura filiformis]|uniref:monocarboxylate transporter 2-like n=1 Tax=Amphiura filiformis TaxID=82378 RepID=UPI003B21105D
MSCCYAFRQWIRDLCRPVRGFMSQHWLWMATLSVFILYFFIGGFMYNYCVLFVRLQEEFHYNAALTGWLGSLMLCLACLSSPVSIFLINRRSPRAVAATGVLICGIGTLVSSYMNDFFALFFTFAIVYGIGANFVYQSTSTLLLMDHRGEACIRCSGIAMTGSALGFMILSPSLDNMITTLGWRYSFRVMAAIFLTICMLSCVFLVQPEEEKIRQLREQLRRSAMIERSLFPGQCAPQDCKRIEIVRSREMRLFFTGYLFSASAWAFYIIHSARFATSVGLEAHSGALLVFVFAAMIVIGQYLLYAINKYLPFSRIYLLVLTNLVSAVATFCFLFSRTMGQLVPLFIAMGLLTAVFQGAPYSAAVELFADTRPSELSSLIMVSLGIGLITGGPLAGGLFDRTGNYNATLLLVALLYVLSTMLYIAIPIRRTLHTRKQRALEARALARPSPPRLPGCRCHLMITGNNEQLSVFDNISTV